MKTDIAFINLLDVMNLYTKSKPLGLLSLYNQLNSAGYSAKVFDFNYIYRNDAIELSNNTLLNAYRMAEYILKCEPRIVSIYTMCNNLNDAILLCEVIKAIDETVTTVLAGPQGTTLAEEVLKEVPVVDIIGYGEGEDTIVDIVREILKHGISGLDSVSGVAYRGSNGVVIKPPCSIVELDRLEPFKFEMIDSFQNISDSSIEMEIGRGCPFACRYCSTSIFWGRKFRVKSVDKVVNEIIFYKTKYGSKKFLFHHDLLTFKKQYILDLCNEIIDRNLDIIWGCYSRLDVIDSEMIAMMAKAGCQTIYFGIESGSPRMQKIINKNLDLGKIKEILPILMENNVASEFSFIVGFPEETPLDLQLTINFAVELRKLQFALGYKNYNLSIDIFQLQFFPKTEMTIRYFDQLEYSEYTAIPNLLNPYYQINTSDTYVERIKSSKSLFVNFYNLPKNNTAKSLQFPRFCMCLLNSMYYHNPQKYIEFVNQGWNILDYYEYLWNTKNEYVMYIISEMIFNPDQGGEKEKRILDQLIVEAQAYLDKH